MRKQLLFFSLIICLAATAQDKKEFSVVLRKEDKRVDILWGKQLITSYRYDDSVRKPFLFPINSPNGVTVTRGWPLEPRPGERTDHPHHTGIWMNYESVNGLDFWNNSTAIAPEKRHLYGTIRHDSIVFTDRKKNPALLTVHASWLHPDGHALLIEITDYFFGIHKDVLVIERRSKLTALKEDVVFKDVKDGFFAIRVARELEMPSQQADVFTDAHGNKTNVPKMINNEGVTGKYISSEKKEGDSVWGTKATWVMLQGKKDNRDITIGIADHPSNPGYPSYWHARGYGLFAVNPFGKKVFSNGKEEFNFTLKAGNSARFRYALIVAEQKWPPQQMNRYAEQFAKGR